MSTLPAKPFIPRSLVGMTQGARKRKARDDKELSEFLVATLAKLEHTEERAKYRIGQKLRPCPGCCACSPCNVSRIHLVRLCTYLCALGGIELVHVCNNGHLLDLPRCDRGSPAHEGDHGPWTAPNGTENVESWELVASILFEILAIGEPCRQLASSSSFNLFKFRG